MKTSYPAQIVFLEDESRPYTHGLGRWRGRLLNPRSAIDIETGGPAQGPRFDITQTAKDRFEVLIQGGSRHGRRYNHYQTLTDAQKAGIRWAGRRFRVPA